MVVVMPDANISAAIDLLAEQSEPPQMVFPGERPSGKDGSKPAPPPAHSSRHDGKHRVACAPRQLMILGGNAAIDEARGSTHMGRGRANVPKWATANCVSRRTA
jgi:hypothetical protein